MRFAAPLEAAILVKRYKRFLADVRLADDRILTVHCPNTGAMLTCSTPGSRVCLSQSNNPRRKYRRTLELVRQDDTWVGVNTGRANALVAEGIENGRVAELAGPTGIRQEVRTSPGCRLDLAVFHGLRQTFVEIKTCTYVDEGWAMFPDAVTSRGVKHLLELAELVRRGSRGVVFFLVQRSDATGFRPAAAIDPLYARTLGEVHRAGVDILAYQTEASPEEIAISRPLPFSLL